MRYYYVTKVGNSWSQPALLNMAYQSLPGSLGWDFAMARDSSIYFSVYTSSYGSDIYRSNLLNGQYSIFERLPSEINTTFNEISNFIDPREKYILFGSNRTGSYGLHDVYVSFKKTDGTWTPAQNMGDKINGPNEDSFPWVTPDGKYLFFNSAKTGDLAYNAYWVDSKVIDRLKPVGINNTGEIIPKEYQLFQNHPNPFNPVTKIRFDIPALLLYKGGICIKVFDILGKEIATLVNEALQPGTYEVTFDGSNFPGGIYFYKLTAGKYSETKKMLMIK
jgi:hypothetical protein